MPPSHSFLTIGAARRRRWLLTDSIIHHTKTSQAFQALEVGMGLLLFALLDGAFSGDWTEYGLISDATEGYLKAAAGTVLFAHVCLAGLTSVVAEAKGRNDDAIVHILRTLAVC